MVALRKESVDRNSIRWNWRSYIPRSLSARRAWIEIAGAGIVGNTDVVALRKESVDRNYSHAGKLFNFLGRSPQGERG